MTHIERVSRGSGSKISSQREKKGKNVDATVEDLKLFESVQEHIYNSWIDPMITIGNDYKDDKSSVLVRM